MAGPRPDQDPGVDAGAGHDDESTAGTPRWVKVSGVIALVVVLLFAVLHLTIGGRGGHTP